MNNIPTKKKYLILKYVTEILPWHSLHKTFSKMVEGNCHLHFRVPPIAVTVTQHHNLVPKQY